MSGARVIQSLWTIGESQGGQATLMAFIGHVSPDGVEAARRAAQNLWDSQRVRTDAVLVPDLCVFPYLGLGMMRNYAVLEAIEGLYDYLLLLEDDVVLPEEGLALMVRARLDAVVPHLDASRFGPGIRLAYPQSCFAADGQIVPFVGEDGITDWVPDRRRPLCREIDWAVVSCILFSGDALRRMGPQIFPDSGIARAEDEYMWRLMRAKGVQLYQHLGVRAVLTRPPGLIDKVFDLWVHDKGLVRGIEAGLNIARENSHD